MLALYLHHPITAKYRLGDALSAYSRSSRQTSIYKSKSIADFLLSMVTSRPYFGMPENYGYYHFSWAHQKIVINNLHPRSTTLGNGDDGHFTPKHFSNWLGATYPACHPSSAFNRTLNASVYSRVATFHINHSIVATLCRSEPVSLQ